MTGYVANPNAASDICGEGVPVLDGSGLTDPTAGVSRAFNSYRSGFGRIGARRIVRSRARSDMPTVHRSTTSGGGPSQEYIKSLRIS